MGVWQVQLGLHDQAAAAVAAAAEEVQSVGLA
jgi:hypothetical protein